MKTRFYKILHKNKDVVYIGVTTRAITERFREHLISKGLNENYSVVEFDCIEHPELNTLEIYYAEKRKVIELEQRYIREELEKGSHLLNISAGGEWGCTILEKLRKEEFRKKFGSYDNYTEYKKKVDKFKVWIGSWVHHRDESTVRRWVHNWVFHKGESISKGWVHNWVLQENVNKVKKWLGHWVECRSCSESMKWVRNWVRHKCEDILKVWIRSWVHQRGINRVKKWLKHWVSHRSTNKTKKWMGHWTYNKNKSKSKKWVHCWIVHKSNNDTKEWMRSWLHHRSANKVERWLGHWVQCRSYKKNRYIYITCFDGNSVPYKEWRNREK